MITHIIPIEKFTYDYINRINSLFDQKEHYFLIYGKPNKSYNLDLILKFDNCSFSDHINNNKHNSCIINSESVIFHSLFFGIRDMKYLCSIKKIYNINYSWVIWGADLYDAYDYSHSLAGYLKIKPLIREFYRKSLILNIELFITGCDYEELQLRYKLKKGSINLPGKYTYNFIPLKLSKDHIKRNVLVGHSATPTCRHIETFKLLKKYSKDIEVYCPLSYPKNHEYIEKVSKMGYEYFGDHFHPIIEYMDYNEYINFLNTIDIGVFNNNRQQGMGNITNLLYLGKKVYLSKDNTIRLIYPKDQYAVFDIDEISDSTFIAPLKPELASKNREKVLYLFSDENFKKEWSAIFNYGKKDK